MRLALVRHAIAEPRRPDAPDADRELTPKVRRRFRRSARALGQLPWEFQRLLHSPWNRAVETAELLRRWVPVRPEPEPLLARAPGPPLLQRLAGKDAVLVGHEPWLSQLLGWLVTGRRGETCGLLWRKGGVGVLEGDPEPGKMHLLAFLPPGVLRRWAQEL